MFNADGFEVFLDPASAGNFEGATVDFVEGVMQSGFRVFHPSPSWDNPLAQKVQDVLDQHINPGVAGHGGSVTLERVEGDTAFITLGGGCQGCGAADVTLRHGIERMIRGACARNPLDRGRHRPCGGGEPLLPEGRRGRVAAGQIAALVPSHQPNTGASGRDLASGAAERGADPPRKRLATECDVEG